MRRLIAVGLLFTSVVLASSCASYRYSRQATEAVRAENWDAAVYYYLELLATNPSDPKVKMELQRARLKAANEHFRLGMRFKEAGELQRARVELELTTQLDTTNQYAETELKKVRRDLDILSQEGGPGKLEAMKKAASEAKVKPPVLNPASDEPLSLSFPNPTNVRDIYKALGQAFGINVLFDPKIKDAKISIELKDVTARRALETVMQAAGHFYKVLDDKSVIIVEDTPQNRRDYEDLVVKTFFLSNADVKDINNMLRSLIDARRIATNEQLNSIVIRDTADKVAIAERLVNANDKSKAEIIVDVELLQVDSSKIRDIGTSLSSYSYNLSLDASQVPGYNATTGRVPIDSLGDITRSMWGMVVPSITVNLIKSAGEAETLAQPQLRITEGEKSTLVIGDRVPIPTTTFNTSQTVGGNIVPVTAFQYQDVGITIEIEPRVHHNNEITLKLKVEFSELGEYIEVSPGQKQPKIGTRTINSVIRLKDGETSLLAGLIRYNNRESRSGMPWLSDIPVIGALFRSNYREVKKTDLVLTLTPHIIRNPDITEEDLAPIWVGTESRVTVSGSSPRVQSASPSTPFGEGEGGAAEQQGEEGSQEEADKESQPGRGEGKGERQWPRVGLPGGASSGGGKTGGGDTGTVKPTKPGGGGDTSNSAAALLEGSGTAEGLARVAFFPARLPALVGQESELVVQLEPGVVGVSGPLHLAYDPQRLEVVRTDGGDLQTASGNARVTISHTPALGWLSASWSGVASGTGTLVHLTVRPRKVGETPVLFAGPVGAIVASEAVVVGLPADVPLVTGGSDR